MLRGTKAARAVDDGGKAPERYAPRKYLNGEKVGTRNCATLARDETEVEG